MTNIECGYYRDNYNENIYDDFEINKNLENKDLES